MPTEVLPLPGDTHPAPRLTQPLEGLGPHTGRSSRLPGDSEIYVFQTNQGSTFLPIRANSGVLMAAGGSFHLLREGWTDVMSRSVGGVRLRSPAPRTPPTLRPRRNRQILQPLSQAFGRQDRRP